MKKTDIQKPNKTGDKLYQKLNLTFQLDNIKAQKKIKSYIKDVPISYEVRDKPIFTFITELYTEHLGIFNNYSEELKDVSKNKDNPNELFKLRKKYDYENGVTYFLLEIIKEFIKASDKRGNLDMDYPKGGCPLIDVINTGDFKLVIEIFSFEVDPERKDSLGLFASQVAELKSKNIAQLVQGYVEKKHKLKAKSDAEQSEISSKKSSLLSKLGFRTSNTSTASIKNKGSVNNQNDSNNNQENMENLSTTTTTTTTSVFGNN